MLPTVAQPPIPRSLKLSGWRLCTESPTIAQKREDLLLLVFLEVLGIGVASQLQGPILTQTLSFSTPQLRNPEPRIPKT